MRGFLFARLPKAFLLDEDQGILFAQVTPPPGTSEKYTQDVLDRMNEYFLTKERAAVDSVLTVAGFSFGGRGQSSGLIFIRLKDWAKRPGANHLAQTIATRAMSPVLQHCASLSFAFAPPPPRGLRHPTEA